jgi:hypothetical protein
LFFSCFVEFVFIVVVSCCWFGFVFLVCTTPLYAFGYTFIGLPR